MIGRRELHGQPPGAAGGAGGAGDGVIARRVAPHVLAEQVPSGEMVNVVVTVTSPMSLS